MALRYVQELNWLYDNNDDKLRVSYFGDSVLGLLLLFKSVSQKTSAQRKT